MSSHVTPPRGTGSRFLRSRSIRLLAAGTLATAALTLGVGVASAHVVVSPSTAAAGSYSVLTFRVPNESATAGTVGLTIHLPTDTPLASVSYQNVPGWTAKAVTEQLPKPVTEGTITIDKAVTTVTFTADKGTRIAPGEFAQFSLSVGPLPDAATLSFPTDQTYDDGSVVKWADPTTPGGAEPDHPAPTITLTAADDAGHPATSGAATSGAAASGAPTVTTAPDVTHSAAPVAPSSTDTVARVLGIVGIVLAALALLVGALGLRRRPAQPARRANPTATGQDDLS